MKEIEKEGVPANIESTIRFFKEGINPSSRKSGRLFDQDLNNKDQVFLDIGCGIGKHLLILRNNGIRHALGFDIVPDMVEIARKEFNLENLFVANALRIPLPDGSVDRCFFYNVIEHCSAPGKALEEIHRILRKDGILYVDVPNARSMGDRIFRWGGKIIYGKTSHIQKFTRKRIESLVENIGFDILKCRVGRGIFVDFPQVKKFTRLKRILKFLFDKEIRSWEMALKKIEIHVL